MNVMLVTDEHKISLSRIDFFTSRRLFLYLCYKNLPLLPFLTHWISRLLFTWYLLHSLGIPTEIMGVK